jgi:hypothetical protein
MILVEKEWEQVVLDGTIRSSIVHFSYEKWVSNFGKRESFRKGISWHIPTRDLVDTIKKYSPIVSVGCGFAYTEKLAEKEGADIILTDISPDLDNKWCKNDSMNFPTGILKMDAKSAVESFKDRNVFMAWPPYANEMAYKVANAMKVGKYLIYVGESHGGCTGDDNFFNLLYKNFEEVDDDINIPSWDGIYDNAVVYKKIKR